MKKTADFLRIALSIANIIVYTALLILIAIVCCLAMTLVDGVIRPGYVPKSVIKICLFLLLRQVWKNEIQERKPLKGNADGKDALSKTAEGRQTHGQGTSVIRRYSHRQQHQYQWQDNCKKQHLTASATAFNRISEFSNSSFATIIR